MEGFSNSKIYNQRNPQIIKISGELASPIIRINADIYEYGT
jgi:hypothetical protein